MPINASTAPPIRPKSIDRTANLTVRTAPCTSTGSDWTSSEVMDMRSGLVGAQSAHHKLWRALRRDCMRGSDRAGVGNRRAAGAVQPATPCQRRTNAKGGIADDAALHVIPQVSLDRLADVDAEPLFRDLRER